MSPWSGWGWLESEVELEFESRSVCLLAASRLEWSADGLRRSSTNVSSSALFHLKRYTESSGASSSGCCSKSRASSSETQPSPPFHSASEPRSLADVASSMLSGRFGGGGRFEREDCLLSFIVGGACF